MVKRGSQIREDIKNTSLVVLRFTPDEELVIRDIIDRHFELWHPNNDFAGYVLVVDGQGYEFVASLSEPEVLAMP